MNLDEIKEEAIACGWIDLFENEGKLWGYASDRDVMPQLYPNQPNNLFETPVYRGQGCLIVTTLEDPIGRLYPVEGAERGSIARNDSILHNDSVDRNRRDTIRRLRDTSRHPWLPDLGMWSTDPRGYRIPQTPWLELLLSSEEAGEGRRSLRIENIQFDRLVKNFMELVAYSIQFSADRIVGGELLSNNCLMPGQKIVFCPLEHPPLEYRIRTSRIIAVGNHLKVELEIAC